MIKLTVLPEPVISDESVWKMNTAVESPPASRTKGPVRLNADLLGPAYTPASVSPPRWLSSSRRVAGRRRRGRRRSNPTPASAAAALVVLVVHGGSTAPGGNPVMSVPGESPRLPSSVLLPMLVTVWPTRARVVGRCGERDRRNNRRVSDRVDPGTEASSDMTAGRGDGIQATNGLPIGGGEQMDRSRRTSQGGKGATRVQSDARGVKFEIPQVGNVPPSRGFATKSI